MGRELEVGAFLALSAGIKYLVHHFEGNKVPTAAKLVGKVKCIRLYPVKSMGGIQLTETQCTATGLLSQGVFDRQWLLVTAQNHKFITARAQPKLVTIECSIHEDGLHLNAEGKSTLVLRTDIPQGTVIQTEVWGQTISGLDAGDEAAAWVEKVLGKPEGTYRLLLHGSTQEKRVLNKQKDTWQQQCKQGDEIRYQDGFPFHLLSNESLLALSDEIKSYTGKEANISMDNFRPNIEIEGGKAYQEDDWQEIYIGDVKFSQKKKCDRCIMTTVDSEKGAKRPDAEPLNTMKRIRPFVDGSPTFGINLVLDRPGTIKVGMPVYSLS